MTKATSKNYKKTFQKYYRKKKAVGWRSYTLFGPEHLLAAVKEFIRDYKTTHALYERKHEWTQRAD